MKQYFHSRGEGHRADAPVPDPWDGAAAIKYMNIDQDHNENPVESLQVPHHQHGGTGDRGVQLTFRSPTAENEQVVDDVFAITRLELSPDTADL